MSKVPQCGKRGKPEAKARTLALPGFADLLSSSSSFADDAQDGAPHAPVVAPQAAEGDIDRGGCLAPHRRPPAAKRTSSTWIVEQDDGFHGWRETYKGPSVQKAQAAYHAGVTALAAVPKGSGGVRLSCVVDGRRRAVATFLAGGAIAR